MEFLKKCPSCGRRFVLKILSKKLVGSEHDTERVVRDVMVAPPPLYGQRGGFTTQIYAKTAEEVPIERDTFDVTYECGHCHHEWSETLTKVEKE